MAILDGDETIRIGSQDYKSWQLYSGNDLIDLSDAGITEIRLLMKESPTADAIKTFSTIGATPKLFVVAANTVDASLTGYALQLRPAADEFSTLTPKKYYIYAVIIDNIGPHPVPEDKEYFLTIRAA